MNDSPIADELRRVALHDPFVHRALTLMMRDGISLETTLVKLVVTLSDERQRLSSELIQCHMERGPRYLK